MGVKRENILDKKLLIFNLHWKIFSYQDCFTPPPPPPKKNPKSF